METQDLKTLLLKEAGEFDKWDISAALKFTDEELNQEIKKIRKKRKLGFIVAAFPVILIFLNLISIKTGFLSGWLPNWDIVIFILLYDMYCFYQLGTQKKKEYIYQLLLKLNKAGEPALKAVG